jgi:uncharacterized protein with PIN domain
MSESLHRVYFRSVVTSDISHVGTAAGGSAPMLYGLSKQIAHCFFRAAQCSERAALSVNAADREFYLEREKAWLTLARSYEYQERLQQVLNEKQRQSRSHATPIVPATNCPHCNVEMRFQGAQPTERVFIPLTLKSERAFFLCQNCGWLAEQLTASTKSP